MSMAPGSANFRDYRCGECGQEFKNWRDCFDHIRGYGHWGPLLPVLTYRRGRLYACKRCDLTFDLPDPSDISRKKQAAPWLRHVSNCCETVAEGFHCIRPKSFECPVSKVNMDSWKAAQEHIQATGHLRDLHPLEQISQLFAPHQSSTPTPKPQRQGRPCATLGLSANSPPAFLCPKCGTTGTTWLDCARHLLDEKHIVRGSLFDLTTEVDTCLQKPWSLVEVESLPVKEAQAFKWAVDEIKQSKNGSIGSLEMEGLKKFANTKPKKFFENPEYSELFQLFHPSLHEWRVRFSDKVLPDPSGLGWGPERFFSAADGTAFMENFRKQDVTDVCLLPLLPYEQMVRFSKAAVADGLHVSALASTTGQGRILLGKRALDNDDKCYVASQSTWLFDDRYGNGPMQEFLGDPNRKTFVLQNMQGKAKIEYYQQIAFACGLKVHMMQGKMEVTKSWKPDGMVSGSKVQLKQLFSQSSPVQDQVSRKEARPPQAPVAWVSSDVHVGKAAYDRLQAAFGDQTAIQMSQDLDFSTVEEPAIRHQKARRPNPDARYPISHEAKASYQRQAKSLPIYAQRGNVISSLRDHRVAVLSGATGCGKTTQVPQFILDSDIMTREAPVIIVTQPRRIAAMSVATRVAQERGQRIGHEVGYSVRFDTQMSADTKLLFVTPGVLLKRLQADPTLEGVGCIVLDEVHERDISTDFALLVIKQLMLTGATQARVLLMSATLQADKLVHYFGNAAQDGIEAAAQRVPLIRVEGRAHPVKDYYLEDALKWTNFGWDENGRLIPRGPVSTHVDRILSSDVKMFEQEVHNEVITALRSSIGTVSQLLFRDPNQAHGWSLQKVYEECPIESLGGREFLLNAGLERQTQAGREEMEVEVHIRLGDGNGGVEVVGCKIVTDQYSGGQTLNPGAALHARSVTSMPNSAPPAEDNLPPGLQRNPKVDPLFVAAIIRFFHHSHEKGAVLVFLPGMADIRSIERELLMLPIQDQFDIIKCHSNVPSTEQQRVFRPAASGKRKIVLSTNIAESSITVEDVIFVIDCCLAKEQSYNLSCNAGTLESSYVSQTNIVQRRGRAGRVKAGISVHLIPKEAVSLLAPFPTPEMLRTPLEDVCLKVRAMGVENIEAFLEKGVDPPSSHAIAAAIQKLILMQCLAHPVPRGIPNPNQFPIITPLGKLLTQLPLTPHLGRMMVIASLLGCAHDAATIAACLVLKSIFLVITDPMVALDIRRKRQQFLQSQIPGAPMGHSSDHLLLLMVVKHWESCPPGSTERADFCTFLGLNNSAIASVIKERDQIGDVMVRELAPEEGSGNAHLYFNRNAGKLPLLVAMLTAAMYPNVALPLSDKKWRTSDGHNVKPGRDSLLSSFRPVPSEHKGGIPCVPNFTVYFERAAHNYGKELSLREGTMCGPLPFVMGCQSIQVERRGKTHSAVVDGWLVLLGSQHEMEALKMWNKMFSAVMQFSSSCGQIKKMPTAFLEHVVDVLMGYFSNGVPDNGLQNMMTSNPSSPLSAYGMQQHMMTSSPSSPLSPYGLPHEPSSPLSGHSNRLAAVSVSAEGSHKRAHGEDPPRPTPGLLDTLPLKKQRVAGDGAGSPSLNSSPLHAQAAAGWDPQASYFAQHQQHQQQHQAQQQAYAYQTQQQGGQHPQQGLLSNQAAPQTGTHSQRWQQVYDPNHKAYFYVDHLNGASQWEAPAEFLSQPWPHA